MRSPLTLSPWGDRTFTSSKMQFPTVSRLSLTPQAFEVTKESSSTTAIGEGDNASASMSSLTFSNLSAQPQLKHQTFYQQ